MVHYVLNIPEPSPPVADTRNPEDWNNCMPQTVDMFLKKIHKLIEQGKIDPCSTISADGGHGGIRNEIIGVKQSGEHVVLLHARSHDEDVRGGIPFAVWKSNKGKKWEKDKA